MEKYVKELLTKRLGIQKQITDLSTKREEFDKLRAKYPSIVPAEPNNAFLVSIALYNELGVGSTVSIRPQSPVSVARAQLPASVST